MKMTQGQFSFLPDLSDDDIRVQAQYAIDRGWAVSVEYTDDPHPRNTYWEIWGHPMFDNPDAAAVVFEVNECRKVHGGVYIRVIAFDASPGWESIRMAMIVNRPAVEPGFRLVRQEGEGRTVRYSIESYAMREPEGARYP